MKSVFVEVIASSLVSRFLERPVRLSELQFCELTVKYISSHEIILMIGFSHLSFFVL